MRNKIAALALVAALVSTHALGQSQTLQLGPGQAIGNDTAAQRNSKAVNLTSLFDRAFGAPASVGCMFNRGASVFTCTLTPTLGATGVAPGSLTFQNASTGQVTLQPVTGALGTRVILIPAAAGTMAVSVSLPLVESALGNLTCPTCVTSSGGGAITGTLPISVSGAGVVSVATGNLTKTDDTNVTMTLGGTPTGALHANVSMTLGWTGTLGVARGGIGIGSGTSGGILGFTATGTLASSGLLTANAIMLGGGAGATPTVLGSLGTTTTLLHGNAAGAPTYGQVVSGDIATAAFATGAQYLAGSASNVIIPPSVVYPTETVTTFGATTTFDFSTFINTAVTMTANTTTQTLSNVVAGKSFQIRFIQDATGSRTTVWNSILKFTGGLAPTLTTAANAVDVLVGTCVTATYCVASLISNVK